MSEGGQWSRAAYTRMIRQIFKPSSKREPCAVCGKYKAITHAHHLVSVKQIVDTLYSHNVDPRKLNKLQVQFVWLCPNHHALFHLFERGGNPEALSDMDDVEREVMARLFDEQNYSHLFSLISEANA